MAVYFQTLFIIIQFREIESNMQHVSYYKILVHCHVEGFDKQLSCYMCLRERESEREREIVCVGGMCVVRVCDVCVSVCGVCEWCLVCVCVCV
jgi:hypothetical protein